MNQNVYYAMHQDVIWGIGFSDAEITKIQAQLASRHGIATNVLVRQMPIFNEQHDERAHA